MTKIRNRAVRPLAVAVALLVPTLGTVATASATTVRPAFSGSCWSGIDSWGNGQWGWGSCTGYGTFQVRVNCTWAQNNTSNVITVNGGNVRTDVECPDGTKVNTAVIIS